MKLARLMMWITVALAILAALLTIIAIVRPFGAPYGLEESSGAAFVAMLACACAWGCAYARQKGHHEVLMIGGVGAAGLTVAGMLFIGFESVFDLLDLTWPQREGIGAVVASLATAMAVTTGWGLLSLLRLDGTGWRDLRRAVKVLSLVPAVLGITLCWEPDWSNLGIEPRLFGNIGLEDFLVRAFGVAGTIVMFLACLVPVGAILESHARRQRSRSLVQTDQVELTCPSCGESLILPAGQGACTHCGVWIRVEVEVPRCGCGHLLYQSRQDQCPECGRPIPIARAISMEGRNEKTAETPSRSSGESCAGA